MDLSDNITPPAPAEEAPKPRGRWLSRARARRIAVLRDVLASIKDAGLIAGAVALLLFHDQVAEALSGLTLGGNSAQVFDVQAALKRLGRAADSQPTLTELPAGQAVAAGKPLSAKALRAEQKLLASDDAEFIADWAVVVATTEQQSLADAVRASLPQPKTAWLVRKGERIRVLLPVDGPTGARAALNRLRVRFPTAVAISLRDWCDPDPQAAAPQPCRRP